MFWIHFEIEPLIKIIKILIENLLIVYSYTLCSIYEYVYTWITHCEKIWDEKYNIYVFVTKTNERKEKS